MDVDPESKERAHQRWPASATPGARMYRAIDALVAYLELADPGYFEDPCWPETLCEEIEATLTRAGLSQTEILVEPKDPRLAMFSNN